MGAPKYSDRELVRILKRNGYYLHRWGKGSHSIYKRDNDTIVLSHNIDKLLVDRMIREHNLVV